MKKYSLILLFGLLSIVSAWAQPSDADMIRWLEREKIKQHIPDIDAFEINKKLKILYLTGSFTAKNTQECIVMLPIIFNGNETFDYLILMQKTRNGWMDSQLLEKGVMDAKLRDVDKDGLLELWTETSGMRQGNVEGRYELLSFKGQQTLSLFSSEYFDYTSGMALSGGMEVGAEVEREVSIQFKEENGKEVLIETVILKTFKELKGEEVLTESQTTTTTYLLNGEIYLPAN